MIIGVFGLGIIGSTIAKNLKADGYEVRAWNRTPRPDFPGAVESAAEAARGADLLMIVVSDPEAVESVLTQVLPSLKEGAVVAQHSTIGRSDTLNFASQVRARGGRFLDMPFTGSKPAAETRQTYFFVGDDDDSFQLVEPVYRKISKGVGRVGPVGRATALKLAMNVNNALLAEALSESCALAEKAGIPREAFLEMLESGVGRSGLSELKKLKLLTRDYSAQFSVVNMRKDLRLALKLADEVGATLPTGSALLPFYDDGISRGFGNDDFISLIRALE